MAVLRKIGRIYYSDLYIGKKRVIKRLDSDRRIAESKLADLVKERDASVFGRAPVDASWQSFREKYLTYCKAQKSKFTVVLDDLAIRDLERVVMPRTVSQVSPLILEQVQSLLKKDGEINSHVNRRLRSLKAMMRKAEAWGYTSPQKWDAVRGLKEPRGRLNYFTPQEVGKLFRGAKGYWKTVVLLGARAGLRRSEMYWLSWDDVDFGRCRLHIAPKGDWEPKDHERRWVPMAQDLLKHLRNVRNGSGWVLDNGKGRPDNPDTMTAYFRKIVRLAGIHGKGGIHTLRHTFASHLASAGVPLFAICKLLGHSSVKMTEIYAHLAPDQQASAVTHLPPIPL